MHFLLLFLCTLPFSSGKIFYTDKDSEQSVPLPINSDRIRVFQDKILTILGLERPNTSNNHTYNADQFASKFMSALYELLMTENEKNKVDSEIGQILTDIGQESRSADTIVSFIPEDIRPSDESFDMMYEATFSVKNLGDGRLIAARMFVVLENLALLQKNTTLRVYRKKIGAELVEVGSQILSNYDQFLLVSLNITQLIDGWISNQQPFPKQQKIYLELNGPNGTAIELSKLKNLHCFGIGLFVDRPHDVERRVRRSLSLDLSSESETTTTPMSSSTISTPMENTTPSKTRLDKLSAPTSKKCGLRSLYVDFKDLGWSDWIIAPQGYFSDYCSGECGFPLDNSVVPINHAIVQTLVHMLDKRRAGAAKCAAIDLSSQNILFLNNEQNLVMKKYQNMRVKNCGCL